jgi:hypothetical protein
MGEIKGTDIFEASAIKAPLEFAKNMDVALDKVEKFIDLMKQSEGAIGLAKSTKKVREENSKLLKSQQELQKLEQQILAVRGKLIASRSDEAKQLAELKVQNTERNKKLKEEARETRGLMGAFDRLRKSRDKAAITLKNLIASEKASTAEINKAQRAFDKLEAKTQKANKAAKQFQGNVGNYPTLFKSATSSLKMFIGAFGFIGGIALFARTITDAFKRIREFDKAAVELAAILGSTREEISGLEDVIIKVASASTKTSTEVAQLATTLATLGKTESEIKNLLKPVNNLSISLKSTSQEAGELLVSTLNAFGQGSSEAGRFADIIAKMRTSTALDFEKIKNSLGFLAPTARAAGVSLERTGAILGILVDNGKKAASAGRLTSTSFLKLAKDGLTLEDALDKINIAQAKTSNEQVILAEAGRLFGAEAAGIGLILANNRVKVDELTEALENSKGTLDELTKAQLESFDAKLKILDSSWERFILNITKGDNVIAKDLKNSIATLTGWFDNLSDAMDGTDRKFENWKDKVKESDPSAKKLSISIDNLNEKLAKNKEILSDLPGGNAQIFRDQINAQEEIIKGLEEQKVFILELQQAKQDKADEEIRIANEVAEKEIAAAKLVAKEKALLAKKSNDARLSEIILNQVNQQQADIDELESLDKLIEAELKAEQELNDEIERITQSRLDAEFDANKKAIEDQKKIEEKAEVERIAAIAAFRDTEVQLASETANRLTDLRLQRIDQEISALEMARNRELEVEGITAEQKDAINKKFDAKKRDLQIKQANAEKQNALFQIAINTAVAVTKITAEAALAAPFLIPGIIALGAIQAAAVLVAPIPQFDEGAQSTPKDYIAGEKRPELRKSKGSWSLVKEPTMFKNSPGDTIVSGKETDSILGSMADLTGNNMLTDPGLMLGLLNNDFQKKKQSDDLAYMIKKNGEDVVRAINKKKFVDVRVNTARAFVTEIRGQTRIDHINQQYRS